MSEFKEGQRVRVEFEGVIKDTYSHNACAKIVDSGAEEVGWYHYVYLNSPGVKVTLADPESWPPRVGDIWEAGGREWYTRQNMACGDEIIVGTFDRPSQDYYQRDLGDFKALNPVLVRRRGQ
jgi:hypothetical protein